MTLNRHLRTAHASPRRLARIVAISVAAAFGCLQSTVASAQMVVRMTASGGPTGMGGMQRPAMTPKELDGYAGILGLDEAQKEAAKELLTDYTAEFEKASKEQAEKTRRIADEFRETKDDEVWEQMGPINEKYTKRVKELESALLNDIKAVCTEKQLNQWPHFERTRRRDRTIDRGTVSGESVDLARIVKDLELTGEARTNVAQQLDSYELDLDRTLVARNKLMDEQAASFQPGRGRMEFDIEKFQKQMADLREAGAKVRDVNQRYARAIESVLPDNLKSRFQLDVKRASFPAVYRQSRTDRAFEAALKFDDLDAKQKEAVASLRQSYEQEAAALNEKWAAAIIEDEKGEGGAIAGGNGGVVMLSFGDDDSNKPTEVARKARRDADKKALQSLEALLNDAQKERLPKPGDEPGAGVRSITLPGNAR